MLLFILTFLKKEVRSYYFHFICIELTDNRIAVLISSVESTDGGANQHI